MKKIVETSCQAFVDASTVQHQPFVILQLAEDDENTAVMRFFNSLWQELLPVYEDIKNMKTSYDTDCKPLWMRTNLSQRLVAQTFNCVFSLYPKEWFVSEITNDVMLEHDLAELRSIEPWWKLILGNKALLPLLWSMYPNHPSLLPAYYTDPYNEIGMETV